ncbi:MAG: MarR family winged helix-turn-helix transcriptional regulator [Candidatus Limnocylindria bacterium]
MSSASGAHRAAVADDPLATALIATVPPIMRHLLAHARRRPAWTDMTYQQYNVLRIIGDGESSQAEIARRLIVTAPVVTRLANVLAEAALVERREDPDDRRALILTLTDEGRARVRDMRRDLLEAARELLEPLPAEQRTAVADALDQLQLLVPERSAPR